MTKLPLARNRGLVVQQLNSETLIYDLESDQAYCLNETAGAVFNACDGQTSFDELKSRHRLTDEIVYLALDELKKENLVTGTYISGLEGMSRRQAIRKVGMASMIALPIIKSLVAPDVAQAASACTPQTYTQSFSDPGACPSACVNCQCAQDYCAAHAYPCCQGTRVSSNFNSVRIFCNC